jgi:hypothetical protein
VDAEYSRDLSARGGLGFYLRSWVEFFVHSSQSFLVNMGVNLRSGNIDMAEHFLNAS